MFKRFTAEQNLIVETNQGKDQQEVIPQTIFRCPLCKSKRSLFFDSQGAFGKHLEFYHAQQYQTILEGLQKQKEKKKAGVMGKVQLKNGKSKKSDQTSHAHLPSQESPSGMRKQTS